MGRGVPDSLGDFMQGRQRLSDVNKRVRNRHVVSCLKLKRILDLMFWYAAQPGWVWQVLRAEWVDIFCRVGFREGKSVPKTSLSSTKYEMIPVLSVNY
jgi:hypothetical protein